MIMLWWWKLQDVTLKWEIDKKVGERMYVWMKHAFTEQWNDDEKKKQTESNIQSNR